MEYKKLGDIATYINGYAFKPEQRGSEGLPIIRIQDLTGNAYDLGYYNGDYPKKIELNDGDVLISWSASLGVYLWNRGKALLNQHIFKVVFDKVEIDKFYFMYAVEYNLDKMSLKTHGATMKHITKKDFDNVVIPYPDLDYQKDISYRLTSLKRIIEKYQEQLDLLDELIKARFVEMFGDPVENTMNWPEIFIGDKCFVTKLAGFEYTQYIDYEESGEVVMVKAQNVKNGKLNRKDLSFISKKVSDSLPRSQLAPGDVVMTYVGANIGDVAVIDDVYKYHLAPNVAKIRPNAEVYNSIYFMYMLMLLNIYIVKNSADTAKAALGMEKIRKLKVFIPPLELQNQFASFVEEIDKSRLRELLAIKQIKLLLHDLWFLFY